MKTAHKEILELFASDDIKLKNDVHKYLEKLNISKTITKGINWKIIIEKFNKEYEELYKSFGLNRVQSGLFANKIYFERSIRAEVIEKIIIALLDRKNIKQKNEEIKSKIDELFKSYRIQHFIENLDKENLKKIIENDQKKIKEANKFFGKKIKPENIKIYGEIYKKNDKYIEIDGEGNFSKASRIVLKNANNWRNTFKSFNTFKNRNNIYTYQDYQNYLSTLR